MRLFLYAAAVVISISAMIVLENILPLPWPESFIVAMGVGLIVGLTLGRMFPSR